MSKVVTIGYVPTNMRFDTAPVATVPGDERTKHDLVDAFEALNANRTYRDLSSGKRIAATLSVIILMFILFLVLLIVGLATSSRDNDNEEETASEYQTAKGFPNNLAVALLFVGQILFFTSVYLAFSEYRKVKALEHLKTFELGIINELQRRANERLSIVATHERLRFLRCSCFTIYSFKFNVRLHGDERESSVLTGKSTLTRKSEEPLFGDPFKNPEREIPDEETLDLEFNPTKGPPSVLEINKMLQKNA
jgi:preprotein translocase subunit SecG